MTFTKPGKTEEEYFSQRDLENLKKIAQQKRGEMQAAELTQLKETHYGRCARCGMPMEQLVFKGVSIDKCFHCGGVFLDNGELEKLAGNESHFWERVTEIFKF